MIAIYPSLGTINTGDILTIEYTGIGIKKLIVNGKDVTMSFDGTNYYYQHTSNDLCFNSLVWQIIDENDTITYGTTNLSTADTCGICFDTIISSGFFEIENLTHDVIRHLFFKTKTILESFLCNSIGLQEADEYDILSLKNGYFFKTKYPIVDLVEVSYGCSKCNINNSLDICNFITIGRIAKSSKCQTTCKCLDVKFFNNCNYDYLGHFKYTYGICDIKQDLLIAFAEVFNNICKPLSEDGIDFDLCNLKISPVSDKVESWSTGNQNVKFYVNATNDSCIKARTSLLNGWLENIIKKYSSCHSSSVYAA